ncbi:MAG: hypothetical protein HIU89_18330 [Proteobacteria bacterium]|nr:hypothetical protein [Pseudomonadota bacterium]
MFRRPLWLVALNPSTYLYSTGYRMDVAHSQAILVQLQEQVRRFFQPERNVLLGKAVMQNLRHVPHSLDIIPGCRNLAVRAIKPPLLLP